MECPITRSPMVNPVLIHPSKGGQIGHYAERSALRRYITEFNGTRCPVCRTPIDTDLITDRKMREEILEEMEAKLRSAPSRAAGAESIKWLDAHERSEEIEEVVKEAIDWEWGRLKKAQLLEIAYYGLTGLAIACFATGWFKGVFASAFFIGTSLKLVDYLDKLDVESIQWNFKQFTQRLSRAASEMDDNSDYDSDSLEALKGLPPQHLADAILGQQ